MDFRNWCHNENKINKTDLGNITSAKKTFQEAERDMLPPGVVVDEGAAHVSLQSLLEHTLTRYIAHLNMNWYLHFITSGQVGHSTYFTRTSTKHIYSTDLRYRSTKTSTDQYLEYMYTRTIGLLYT